MKLAIATPTYQRSDGTTPKFLNRAYESILKQTYQDYKVFLIGDHYEDQTEFQSFGKMFSPEKFYSKNLPVAAERSKYAMGSRKLWCSGGVGAFNVLIEEILSQGYEYICHLDHDDYWAEDHLEKINDVIESNDRVGCVYTCGEYVHNSYLPKVSKLDGRVIESFPMPTNAIHSSTCINFKEIPLRYRDVFAETGVALEGDIDMWNRLKPYCEQHNLKSFLVSKITCFHIEENNAK